MCVYLTNWSFGVWHRKLLHECRLARLLYVYYPKSHDLRVWAFYYKTQFRKMRGTQWKPQPLRSTNCDDHMKFLARIYSRKFWKWLVIIIFQAGEQLYKCWLERCYPPWFTPIKKKKILFTPCPKLGKSLSRICIFPCSICDARFIWIRHGWFPSGTTGMDR